MPCYELFLYKERTEMSLYDKSRLTIVVIGVVIISFTMGAWAYSDKVEKSCEGDYMKYCKEYSVPSTPTREEFEALKKEVEELKKLLLAAKEYDEKTGEPDCEIDEKVEVIKKIAKLVGVDMESVFAKTST